MVDFLKAIIDILEDDIAVNALISGRVYGDELPESAISLMPRKCIVITHEGGEKKRGFLDIARPSIEVHSYGESYYEAGKVDRAVYDALIETDRKTISGILIHSVAAAGGPYNRIHPETGWRLKQRIYDLAVSETELS